MCGKCGSYLKYGSQEGLPKSWHLGEIYTHEKANCEISGRNSFQGERTVRASALRVWDGTYILEEQKKRRLKQERELGDEVKACGMSNDWPPLLLSHQG